MKTSSGFAWLVSSITLASAGPPEDERVLPRQASLELEGEHSPGRSALELGGPAWTVDGGQADAQLGAALASAGDVNGDGYSDVIVGAYQYDNGQLDEGRAFVYLGSASGLGASPAWTAESNQAEARFGGAVASAGDVDGDGFSDVIVGAWAYDNGQATEGRVFVYHGSASGLATSAAWTAEGEQAGAFFGGAVAGVGDVDGDGFDDVVVGASGWQDVPGEANEGAAFLYLGSASGLENDSSWTPQANQAGANFGIAVASAGDVNGDGFGDVIVGANAYEDQAGQTDEGFAFVYLGSASGLAAGPMWQGGSDQVGANYGIAVGSAGDVNGDGYGDVIVGARAFDGGEPDVGQVFFYLGRSDGLTPIVESTLAGDQADASFGQSVAPAGDVNGDGFGDLLVGSYLFDGNETDEGRAFLFAGTAEVLDAAPSWILEEGFRTQSAGDVNGDGYSDLIAGDRYYSSASNQQQEGRSLLYLGSAGGLGETPVWSVESNRRFTEFGSSVASAGDVNGDGFGDVVVGAEAYESATNQNNEGAAFLYLGSPVGPATEEAWMVEGNQGAAQLGKVASAGDVNGDGFGDVLVGAPGYDGVFPDSGRVSVYLGSILGLSETPAWTVDGDLEDSGLGVDVASGDVNGDGFSDVIVQGFQGGWRVFAFFGSARGLSNTAAWSAGDAQMDGGSSVVGDVDGDGHGDVILALDLGAQLAVYAGSSSGPDTLPTWFLDPAPGEFVLKTGATAGDVDGDGFTDVAVEVRYFLMPEGWVYIHRGSSSGPSPDPAWFTFNDGGAGLSAALDMNGDGFGDLVIGIPDTRWGFMGNRGSGWTRAPQQRTSGGARPIALHGRSDERQFFRVRLTFEETLAGFRWASPAAPTARLEWEVAPLGVALDGSAIESGAPQPITGATLVFDELAEFGPVASNKPYHWRARVRTNNPLFPVTPWTWLHGNGVSEAKLRRGVTVEPTPGVPVPVPATPHPKKP